MAKVKPRFIVVEGSSFRVVDTDNRRDVVTSPGGRSVLAQRTAEGVAAALNLDPARFDDHLKPGDDG